MGKGRNMNGFDQGFNFGYCLWLLKHNFPLFHLVELWCVWCYWTYTFTSLASVYSRNVLTISWNSTISFSIGFWVKCRDLCHHLPIFNRYFKELQRSHKSNFSVYLGPITDDQNRLANFLTDWFFRFQMQMWIFGIVQPFWSFPPFWRWYWKLDWSMQWLQ